MFLPCALHPLVITVAVYAIATTPPFDVELVTKAARVLSTLLLVTPNVWYDDDASSSSTSSPSTDSASSAASTSTAAATLSSTTSTSSASTSSSLTASHRPTLAWRPFFELLRHTLLPDELGAPETEGRQEAANACSALVVDLSKRMRDLLTAVPKYFAAAAGEEVCVGADEGRYY